MKNKWINKIHCDSALEVLKEMPDGLVDMCLCSPPYWSLRDYGIEGQLGLESTFQEYIIKLCDIFDEVKRTLKDIGTIWINIGDTYWGGGQGGSDYGGKEIVPSSSHGHKAIGPGYQSKSLCMIPQRFAIEMINRGWILRNTIIWFKKNCMPSSAKDRFTVDFEYLFFFTKSNETQYWTNEKTFELVNKQPLGIKGIEGKDWEWRKINNKKKKVSLWTGHDYYFEQQFEEYQTVSIERLDRGVSETNKWKDGADGQTKHTMNQPRINTKKMPPIGGIKQIEGNFSQTYSENRPDWSKTGRNKRCIWEITTHSFPKAHFAVYPEELCITPIKAGCPEFICKKCGKAREKIYKETGEMIGQGGYGSKTASHIGVSPSSSLLTKRVKEKQESGYTDCGCNAGFNPGIVLDPFSGAGTTCLVARKLGRQYIGIEINPEYVKMSERRIHNEAGLL